MFLQIIKRVQDEVVEEEMLDGDDIEGALDAVREALTHSMDVSVNYVSE